MAASRLRPSCSIPRAEERAKLIAAVCESGPKIPAIRATIVAVLTGAQSNAKIAARAIPKMTAATTAMPVTALVVAVNSAEINKKSRIVRPSMTRSRKVRDRPVA